MKEMELLRLEGIRRTFDRGRIVALAGVDIAFRANQSVALVGRSGSGKSCLLNIASGLDRPDAGRVFWKDREVASRRDWSLLRRTEIGIVFQEFHLLPTLTARQNVELALLGSAMRASEQNRRVDRMLDQVGLSERADNLPAEMSGGERQRVAIARALVREPTILLADEPTGNLDTGNADSVAELLFALYQELGMALMIVTHDLALAGKCERLVQLSDGRIVEDTMASAVAA
jgi:putative ABC transport system ATP-binding protein